MSEDSITDTSQNRRKFWERIVNTYNTNRPDGTRERNASMLHNAFGRENKEIQKFQGFYLEEMRTVSSGMSEAEIMMLVYQTMMHKPFKHTTTWKIVLHMPKWPGGT